MLLACCVVDVSFPFDLNMHGGEFEVFHVWEEDIDKVS
jgi:hypothetical protein